MSMSILYRVGSVVLGTYLLLPGPEDVATAGLTLIPSGIIGADFILAGLSGNKPISLKLLDKV